MYGGDVVEHDISIITAMQVLNNIDTKLYNVIPIYIYKNNFFIMKNATNVEYYSNFILKNNKSDKKNGYLNTKNIIL